MRNRQLVSSGAAWENEVGYSRAVRVGNHVSISGTTAIRDGKVYAPTSAYHQTLAAIEIIKASLQEAGAQLSDVVRTRIYVTNIDDWVSIGRAHSQYFGIIKPACTMVEVSRLILPDLLVEIEADAIIMEQ